MQQILNAAIIEVSHLSTHKVCLRCNARVEASTSTLGRCMKSECVMLQRYNICVDQLSAKMLSSNQACLRVYVFHCTLLLLFSRRYFDLLERIIEDNGREEKENAFNMDEAGLPLDPKP